MGSSLQVLISLREMKICNRNVCIFRLRWFRGLSFHSSKKQYTYIISAGLSFNFGLSHAFLKKRVLTDGHHIDSIRVPFFPFKVRNPKIKYEIQSYSNILKYLSSLAVPFLRNKTPDKYRIIYILHKWN